MLISMSRAMIKVRGINSKFAITGIYIVGCRIKIQVINYLPEGDQKFSSL